LLSDAAFTAIRSAWKCPLLGMNLDDRVEFFPHGVLATGNDDYGRWAARFDLNLTSSFTAVDWYRHRGCPVRYVPQGFHLTEEFKHPPTDADYDYPFSFVGSWKPERARIVDELARRGVEVATFGNGWPNSRWVESASRVFRRSQINLGIGFALASGQITSAKGRDTECPGVGACYLTTYNWELPMLYEIGKEILCYRGIEELIEVHGFYVKRPADCLRIAQAAHRRCLAEHTWEKRFRKVFTELGFKLQPA
jgi:spore maturation protein CgeB